MQFIIFAQNYFKEIQYKQFDFRFSTPEGDHVIMLNVFKEYSKSSKKKQWCHENWCNYRNLEYASEVRQQLANLAEKAKLEKVSCGSDTEKLRKALLEGLSDNLAELQRDFNYVTVKKQELKKPFC